MLAYLRPDLFVEVELDWRERAVFVLVGSPINGKRPDGYYVDSAGHKVRWHLSAVLDAGGCSEPAARLRELMKGSGREAMLDQVSGYAVVLRVALPVLPALVRQLQT